MAEHLLMLALPVHGASPVRALDCRPEKTMSENSEKTAVCWDGDKTQNH